MNNQEVLSTSYTDSIHSLLNAALDEESLNEGRRNSFTNASVYSQNTRSEQVPPNYYATMTHAEQPSRLAMGERYDPGANREITAKNDSQASASSPPSPPSKKASQDPDPSSSSIPHSSKPTPLPKLQMFVICTLLFSEPLTSTVLFPFIYFMLKDFHLSDDEKEIGAYAGWITSIFFVAQFCTAIGWGKISDRYGRRPVLLIGLIGNSVSSCLFGVSKSLWWAVCTRAFCGIVNGNNGVARSMVSEITDTSNRAKAFSMFGFCWGIGMIGPAIGGYLCQPAQQFPNVFGDWQFFIEYPYFLPCLVSSLGSLFGFFVGYFYLKESNPAVLARQRAHKTKKYGGSAEEHTALLEGHNHCHSHPCPQKQAEEQEEQTDGIFTSLRKITPASMACIVAYSAYAFHCMVFDEILPLYFSAPRYAGGLGSNSRELAKALSITGLQQLFFQFVLFPPLNRVWNTLILSRFSLITLVPVYALMPELSTLQEWLFAHMTDAFARQWTFRFAYMTLLFIRYSLNCMALTSLIIMVSESAAPEVLGTVNGLCQSCLSLVRAFAPTVGGTLWSFSLRTGNPFPIDRHLVYYMMAILSLVGYFQSYRIPSFVALGGRKQH